MIEAHVAQRASHPDWALAYILTDWKRNRAVSKAYKAVCEGSPDAEALTAEALRKCEVYVAALKEVVSQAAVPAGRARVFPGPAVSP